MTSKGGIPAPRPVYTTLSPNGTEDTAQINTALAACPAGKEVRLAAGTFKFGTSQTPLLVTSGITLRGAGAGQTILTKTSGGAVARTGTLIGGTSIFTPGNTSNPSDNAPMIQVCPSRFCDVDNGFLNSYAPGSSSNLTVNGLQGANSITVVDGSIFTVGKFVLLDELIIPSYAATPRGFLNNNTNGTEGTVQVYRGDRVVLNMHSPAQTFQDDPPDAFGYFSRADPPNASSPSLYTDGRFTNEIKEILSIVGNVITFTSPLSITYRTSHIAQLTRYTSTTGTGTSAHITGAGVEDLTVYGSGGGGIFMHCCAYSWIRRVEVDTCFGLGIGIANSFRCEVRDSYVHTSAQPTPSADSYAINPRNGSSELLIENNITRDYCKVIAFRGCGTGSVVAYNYFDDGLDWNNNGSTQDALDAQFQECGANASHLGGCHHVLFEGNWAFNFDSDYTHGNSIYMTVFRNWITGKRTSFTTETGARCAGGASWSFFLSYVGNVFGKSGAMSGWTYIDTRMDSTGVGNTLVGSPTSGWSTSTLWGNNTIWKVGYDPERWASNPDTETLSEIIRDGNYDFVTNSQKWHNSPAQFAIPNSLYLTQRPAFFGSNTWPWVDPSTGTTNTLPAKARYDASTPNVVP